MSYQPRNLRKVKNMTDEEKLRYFGTANRVTVDYMWELESKSVVKKYVAKVRGITVSDGNLCKFDLPTEAREFGKSILAYWKDELKKLEEPCNSQQP